MALVIILVSTSSVTFKVQKVEASGTIYIRADGSVDPKTAPIQCVGDYYTLSDNIFEAIVVEKSNIIIDGARYTLQGDGGGFILSSINNVTIKNTNIKGSYHDSYRITTAITLGGSN